MPPKAKTPAPIDRPLSRAYLREFTGWSTAFPPGVSEPTSQRVMENMLINREGSIRIRPGLRYLSYVGGVGLPANISVVGTHEAFFLNDGTKAYLFAVREPNQTVGFRVLRFSTPSAGQVLDLSHPDVDFDIPQTAEALNFTAATTYVKYLQIDNKILALSDAGETIRIFNVGATKAARKIESITRPDFLKPDKLSVVVPPTAWRTSVQTIVRRNMIYDPSFERASTQYVYPWATGITPGSPNTSGTSWYPDATKPRTRKAAARLYRAPGESPGPLGISSNYVEKIDTKPKDTPYTFSVYALGQTAGRSVQVGIEFRDTWASHSQVSWGTPVPTSTTDWVRPHHTALKPELNDWDTIRVHVRVTDNFGNGEVVWLDDALLEETDTVKPFFDGASLAESSVIYSWESGVDSGPSKETTLGQPVTIPTDIARTTATLISSDTKENQYNYGFFYTFSNELGESAASQVSTIKAQRAVNGWAYTEPDLDDATTPTVRPEVTDPELAFDQLVVYMPKAVFDSGIKQGASRWNLYMVTWSDQDAAPIEGQLVGYRDLKATSTHDKDGWVRLDPLSVLQGSATAPVPSRDSRYNSTMPPSASQGLVAADRLVLVRDKGAAGVIRWTSNRTGEYTTLTPSRGGGYKTLTSGNLYVPACVKLWQNPQSVDTLTVLCEGVDGYSTSYYMSPGAVTSQTDAVSFMGFEETTATPGTVSPYGCEVFNNALYHPLETELMKSTASNYNINHKTMTELISNKWKRLLNKNKIMSSQFDNRLYYIVHNPDGAALEAGCRGNEVWICDAQAEGGSWSRWLVQGIALRKIEVGGKVVMSITRPDGIYCFDEDKATDDTVAPGTRVVETQQPIAWQIETNTQGANRAHDAWANLQQVSAIFGNMRGRVRWGIRGYDVHGKPIDISKVTVDAEPGPADGLPFDQEDHLLVRRTMKEWRFYAGSVGEVTAGQINLVQYRYTPVSVNVGYEYGSVETFEYGRALSTANGLTTTNGVPVPAVDTGRP